MTIIFQDGFENGYIPWYHDSPIQGTGSEPTYKAGGMAILQSSIVHTPNYAFKAMLPANVDAWAIVYKTLSQYYQTLYMSGWVMFDTILPRGNWLMLGPCICSYMDADLVSAYIYNDAGTPKWGLQCFTTDGVDPWFGDFIISALGPSVQTNRWYDIQVMVAVGAGNGAASLWIDGINVANKTGLSNAGGDGGQALNVQVGPYDIYFNTQPFAATTWHDDTIVSTTFIELPIDFLFRQAYQPNTPVGLVLTRV